MHWTMLFIKEGQVGPIEFPRSALAGAVSPDLWDEMEVFGEDGETEVAWVSAGTVRLSDEGLVGTIIVDEELLGSAANGRGPQDYNLSFMLQLKRDDEDDSRVVEIERVLSGMLELKS